jgi:hypothetical protein
MLPDQTRRRPDLKPPATPRSSGSGSGRPSRRRRGLGDKSIWISTTRSTGCASSKGSPLCRRWQTRHRTRRRMTGSGPPLTGGNPRPHPHRPKGRPWSRPLRWARSRPPPSCRWRCRRAPRRRQRAQLRCPSALEEEEAGLLQFEVSSTLSARLRFRGAAAHPSPSFVVRGSPAVLDLVPVKALKLRTSLTTGQRSERVPQLAASVAAAGELSRTMTAAARPHQEGTTVAASQALVPHDPFQGRGRARSGGRSAGGHETVEAPTGGDSAPKGADRGGHLVQPPSTHPRC